MGVCCASGSAFAHPRSTGRARALGDDGWRHHRPLDGRRRLMLNARNTRGLKSGTASGRSIISIRPVDPQRIGCIRQQRQAPDRYLMALKPAQGRCAELLSHAPSAARRRADHFRAIGLEWTRRLPDDAAPTPFSSGGDPDFFDIQTPDDLLDAKRLYTQWACRTARILKTTPNNYNTVQREGVVRWMARWLGKDQPIRNRGSLLLDENEIRCTPDGGELAGVVYDLEDYENELASVAAAWGWPPSRTGGLVARLPESQAGNCPSAGRIASAFDRNGYRIEHWFSAGRGHLAAGREVSARTPEWKGRPLRGGQG